MLLSDSKLNNQGLTKPLPGNKAASKSLSCIFRGHFPVIHPCFFFDCLTSRIMSDPQDPAGDKHDDPDLRHKRQGPAGRSSRTAGKKPGRPYFPFHLRYVLRWHCLFSLKSGNRSCLNRNLAVARLLKPEFNSI